MGERILDQNPTAPIFIIDGLDVGVFASLDEALLQLESIDVKTGEYSSYDAEGRRIQLTVDGDKVIGHLAAPTSTHAHELSAALREFLKAMGESNAEDADCDLQCLVELSRKFIYSPPRIWPFRKRH